jgi:cell division protease FtsH
MTRTELENPMAVLLGGRAAEKLVFGELSTGAADDLVKVANIARSMVMRYGMAEKLGNVAFEGECPAFLNVPGEQAANPEVSEDTRKEIDAAVKAIVDAAYEKALKTLERYRGLLEKGAERLLQKETLVEEDLRLIRAQISQQGGVQQGSAEQAGSAERRLVVARSTGLTEEF